MAKPKLGRIFQRKWRRPDGTTELLPTLWIEWYDRAGKQHRASTGDTSIKKAEKMLKEKHGQEPVSHTVAHTMVVELLDDLVADYVANGRSVEWAQIVAKHLRDHFQYHRATKVDSMAIKEYVESRRAKDIAYSTINRELAFLRRAFNLGSATEPPKVARVPKIKSFKEDNVRKGFFEHGEYIAMKDALPDYLRPVLTFAYYTGCRKSEILGLQWSQVDLTARVIRLEPGTTKNKEGRVLALHGELYQTIAMQAQVRREMWSACPWLFCHEGQPIRDFRGAWDAACEATGVQRHFHDLRRTGVRNLVRSGNSEAVAMRISGHKTRSVFDRYNIVDERDIHNAARRLDEYVQAQAEALRAQEPQDAAGKVM